MSMPGAIRPATRPSPLPPAQAHPSTVPDDQGCGKLAGMAALIAGADSGIGRALAVLFAREGADVALGFHTSRADALVTQRYVEAAGRRCLLLQGSMLDSAWCRSAVRETVDAFGRLDVLVNNAAFQQQGDAIVDITEARLQDTLDATIGGCLRMACAALPHLKPGASIINTSSVAGLRGHALTTALAANLLGRGIRVHAVAAAPAWTAE